MLPTGADPFYTAPAPTPSSSSPNLALIISLSVVGFLLLVVAGIVGYKYCTKDSESNDPGAVQYKVMAQDNMHSSSPNIQDDDEM